jgi:hypothetical protein
LPCISVIFQLILPAAGQKIYYEKYIFAKEAAAYVSGGAAR